MERSTETMRRQDAMPRNRDHGRAPRACSMAWRVAVLAIAALSCGRSAADELRLVRDGQAEAVIVVPDAPLPACGSEMGFVSGTQRTAAEALQKYLEKASGVRVPIVPASETPETGTLVLVGRSAVSDRHGLAPPTRPVGLRVVSFERGSRPGRDRRRGRPREQHGDRPGPRRLPRGLCLPRARDRLPVLLVGSGRRGTGNRHPAEADAGGAAAGRVRGCARVQPAAELRPGAPGGFPCRRGRPLSGQPHALRLARPVPAESSGVLRAQRGRQPELELPLLQRARRAGNGTPAP